MTASLTDALCTRCGLCCDGSLFADVELSGEAEATGLEILGLAVEDDGEDGMALQQPCVALQGTRCGIYEHRPECCRTFECLLLQNVRRGHVAVNDAIVTIAETQTEIRRAKALLDQMGQHDEGLSLKERCADALSFEADAPPALKRKSVSLESAMRRVERLIGEQFLGGTAARRPVRPRRNRRS